jgi:hypothetical protein
MICSYIRHPPSPGRIACVGYQFKNQSDKESIGLFKKRKTRG